MSWLGSGLSQITGQISTFTKEVLTEGTEEVDDHVTELRLARKRLGELEAFCLAQKSENDRLKQTNEELRDKVESTDLQVNALSNEYRAIVQAKEVEILHLKQQSAEDFTEDVYTDHAGLEAVYGADEEGLSQALSSQRHIDSLTITNKKLKSQLAHWKSIGQSQRSEAPDELVGQSITALRTRVKELEEQLKDEVDQHQKQLATLQDVHAQKLHTLHKIHQEQNSQPNHGKEAESEQQVRALEEMCAGLKERCTGLEQQCGGLIARCADLEKCAGLDEKCAGLEEECAVLEEQCTGLEEQCTRLEEKCAGLEEQCTRLEEKCTGLEEECTRLEEKCAGLEEKCAGLEEKSADLEEKCTGLDEKCKELENGRHRLSVDLELTHAADREKARQMTLLTSQLTAVTDHRDQLLQEQGALKKAGLEMRGEVQALLEERMTSQARASSGRRLPATPEAARQCQVEEQVVHLQSQVAGLEQCVEDLELSQADWQMEKEALEEVLLRMKQEADSRQTSEEVGTLNQQLHNLQDKVKSQQEELLDLSGCQADLSKELEERRHVMELLEGELREEKGCRESQSMKHKTEVDELLSRLRQAEEEVDVLLTEKSALLQQSTPQSHQQLLHKNSSSVGSDINDDQSLIESQATRVEALATEVRSLQELVGRLQQEALINEDLIREERGLREEKVEMMRRLEEEWRESKEALEGSLVELDEQHQEAITVVITDRDSLAATNHELQNRLSEQASARLREEALTSARLKEESEVRDSEEELCRLRETVRVLEEEKASLARVVEVLKVSMVDTRMDREEVDATQAASVEEGGRCEEQCDVCGRHQLETEELRSLVEAHKRNLQSQEARYEEELEARHHKVTSLEGQNVRLQQELQLSHTELQRMQQSEHGEVHRDCESRLSELQVVFDETKGRNDVLEEEVSRLTGQCSESCDKCQEAELSITELRENVLVLEKDIADKDKELEENNKEITRLKNLPEFVEERSREANQQGEGSELYQVKKQLERAVSLIPDAQHKYLHLDTSIPDSIPKIDIGCSEYDTLQMNLEEKEGFITELQKRCSSLTSLLEEHSRSTHGSNILVELHTLEGEVRRLRMEREQMMSVLEEKTREVSSLKTEVHRLMTGISQTNKATPTHTLPNQDMSKEAIKKLSQLIKDKDLEVESLQQKNVTLLQVLQEAGDRDGTTRHLAAVIQERDNLVRQVQAFQKDREGIIEALTTKHKESLAYHSEVKRLQAVLADTSDKSLCVERDYNSLQQQHQHKQKAYLKVQNQLANFKQKFVDLEARYQDLVNQREGVVNGGRREADEAGAAGASSQEVHDLRALILSHEEAFSQKDKIHEEQQRTIEEKEKLLGVKEAVLEEKEAELSEMSRRVRSYEDLVNSSQAHLSAMRKQHENAAFTLEGLQAQLDDAMQEKRRQEERADNLQQEMNSHKEAHSQMTIRYNDKEFEVSALREKAATLTGMLQRHGGEEGERREEAQRLLCEVEAASHQAQTFKQERDQIMLALQQTQMDNQDLRMQMSRAQERAVKLERECERLKTHLLQIEEGYTGEALQAEEREKELRTRLATAEERLLSSSAAVKNASVESSRTVEAFHHQVAALSEERDQALLRLAACQETNRQYNTSLTNLQMVLEHFQLDKENQQSSEHELHQRELAAERRETQQLRQELQLMQSQLEETTDALEAAQRLSEQLDRKEEMIAALRQEVQLREKELQSFEEEMAQLTSTTEGKVDKLVIKNVLLVYLTSGSNKRTEVLHVISKLLDFSAQEMAQVGGAKTGGWLGGLLNKVKTAPTPPTTPTHNALNKSFSELFVTFLEKESTPTRAMHLPAEEMAREELEKHTSHPIFNPFSAPLPRDTTHPTPDTTSHLLINPGATPTLGGGGIPMFAAPTVGSGAILRDVLQQ